MTDVSKKPLVLLSTVLFVGAQIHTFDQETFPETMSLVVIPGFYVFSSADAPDTSEGEPFIEFHGLFATAPESTATDMTWHNKGLQVSLMLYRELWDRIDTENFCTDSVDVESGEAKESDQLLVRKPATLSNTDVHVYSATIRFPTGPDWKPVDTRFPIDSSGAYLLVLSNCGKIDNVKVSGNVIVKNAYGYLPGKHFYKMSFYTWLACAYTILAARWMILTIRHRSEVIAIHWSICVVVFLGLAEAAMWALYYRNWNTTGHRERFLCIASIILYMSKSAFSYMLVLVGSLGWGITRPYLEKETVNKIKVVSFSYIVLGTVKEVMEQFRQEYIVSASFMLLCLFPVAIVTGLIFYWVFVSLVTLIETLKERRQYDRLLQFECLCKALITAIVVTGISQIVYIIEQLLEVSMQWKFEWLWSDGIPSSLFFLILFQIMIQWAPQQDCCTKIINRCLGVVGACTNGKEAHLWAEEGGDDSDDDFYWKQARSKEVQGQGPELAELNKESTLVDAIGTPARQEGI